MMTPPSLNRRKIIAGAAAAAAASVRVPPASAIAPMDAPLNPVLSTPGRVIRTVAGLRPYRAQGFRLELERFGRRRVIHNYGHGGCGVTMSWGCAELAADLAADARTRRAAVIGAGALGLATAHVLLARGFDVTVYAKDLPPYTTSNVAAAFWQPASLFSRSAVDDAFVATFRRAARIAHRRFQALANDPRYGVFWIRSFHFSDRPRGSWRTPRPEGDDLYPGRIALEGDDAPWGFAMVDQYHSLMIDPDRFLRALMADIHRAGGRIETRLFSSADDLFRLDEKLIFNCAGLGAKALFDDEALTPIRGDLTMLLPQPEIDYGYVYPSESGMLYMFPRKGALVLGGSHAPGEWSTAPDPAETARMLAGHAALAARLASG